MKRMFFAAMVCVMMLCCGMAWADVAINAATFPDDVFRSYVSDNFDKDSNDYLSDEEMSAAKFINVESKDISSLKGIEYFTALTYLNCKYNNLKALNVSKNTALTILYCYHNQLAALDVSKLTALEDLGCEGNQLTALNVSKNTALKYLKCTTNKLTALDVKKNTALTTLYCFGNNLTALDVSKNTALERLYCYMNPLKTLNVSKNTALTVLICHNNQLTALDLSKNKALTELYCQQNQLKTLDLSSNTALETLYCHTNQLTVLDLDSNTELTKASLSTQTAYGLKITTTGDASYPYQLNFSDYMTSAQTSNVSDVQGLTSSSASIATQYEDGVAKFASKPSAVKYNYATGYKSAKMEVTITGDAPVEDTKPEITTSSLPAGTTASPYTQTLTASGTAPITWTRSSGKLPDGITLATDGTISGTPSAAGSYSFTVKAANSIGSATKKFTLKITNPTDWTAPVITTTTLNPAAVGREYSSLLEATGNPAPTWRTASGTLPAGLTLSADGSISGTPTRAGSFKLTVRAENAAGYAQRQFTLKSQIIPAITTTALSTATVGQSYSETVRASGTTPLTWSAEGLPEGLTFSNGSIRGKARTNGTYPVTVTVSNSAGTDTKILSLDVHAVMPVFGTTSLPAGTWHKAYRTAITMKKGTKPITVEVDGELPDGLDFDADTWTLSGTPNETCDARILTFTATNAEGSVSKNFALTVNGVKPRITTSTLPPAVKGNDYSADLEATIFHRDSQSTLILGQ